jgi:hypothetical protein
METKTPLKVKLVGTDGNVFALGAKVSSALKRGGYPDEAQEFTERLFRSGSYDAALQLMMEYVEVY